VVNRAPGELSIIRRKLVALASGMEASGNAPFQFDAEPATHGVAVG